MLSEDQMRATIAGLLMWAVAYLPVQAIETNLGTLNVETVASGFDQPWGMGFLPNGSVLVTERGGRLFHVAHNGTKSEITGLPLIADGGQGGLLDVLVPRDFDRTGQIYFSYTLRQGRGRNTALAVADLDINARRLRNVETIFEAARGPRSDRHFGSRIVEAPDGTLFLTIGDRGERPSAQDRRNHSGSVIRLNKDGSVPSNNPFVGQPDIQPEIWSFGHRNPQGAALDLDGNLWINEHGAQGGDEVNRIEAGLNYGWPVISYGRHYSGLRIGEGSASPGLEQPEFFWDPSIAPSGMMIYGGDMFPEWRGNIFIGSLKFDYLSRLTGTPLNEVERIQSQETWRVRDVREGPDGAIWLMSVGNGAIYRMSR